MSISATNLENQETNQDFVQVTPQLLDSNKQAQARANIGALAKDDVSKLIQHVELNADKNLQLKFADGSVEVVSLSELLLNRLQLKGVVDTYEDLATITNPKANDAYQVMEDSLVYIYTNSGFQTKGKGFNISLIPNGQVAEGVQQAVSGGEVYDNINPLLYANNLFDNNNLSNIGFDPSGLITPSSVHKSVVLRVERGDEFEVSRFNNANDRFRVGFTEIEPITGAEVLNIVNYDANLKFNTTANINGWVVIWLTGSGQNIAQEDIRIFKKNNIKSINESIFYNKTSLSFLNVENKFNSKLIRNIGMSSGNTNITSDSNSRSIVIEVKENDLIEFNRKSKLTNRLTVGFTETNPTHGTPVINAVDFRNMLDFKITSQINGWLVIYLSNAGQEDYTDYFLFITGSSSTQPIVEDDFYKNYIEDYKENIFNAEMLKNVYLNVSNNLQFSSSTNLRSILLYGNKGDRYYISLQGTNYNRFRIAESVDTIELGSSPVTKTPYNIINIDNDYVIYEFNDVVRQLYIYVTNDIDTFNSANVVIYKLPNFNPRIDVYKKILGNLSYYNADISEDVSPGSTFLDLEASNINDIYDKFDLLVSQYPNFLSKKLIGYGNSGLKDGNDYIPDTNLPIYEYSFKSIKEYEGTNSLNPSGYKVSAAPKVMLVAGLHGDEKSTVWSCYRLLKLILENNDTNNVLFTFKNQLDFNIVPICNPWGFNNNRRELANNIDSNRVFPFLNTTSVYPEVNALKSFVDNNKDAYIFLDYHCLEGSRPLSTYMTSDNPRSWDLFGSFVREVSPRLKEIYGKPQNNVSEGFYTKTNGSLLEKYVYYMYNIPITAVIETYEDYRGVRYGQDVIQASDEIIINYIRSLFS